MVSRRKILSRSRDDLNLDQGFIAPEEEEDVWYQKDKLYKEHIQEVLDKWTQIDDEIWAKVIVFERNRRVAKAYARAPVLTINGSDDGFDGMRIGLCGFDNPMRDPKTEEFKQLIGQGVKIKMDDAGNILIRRYAKSNVFIKSTASSPNEETSIGADILKLPHNALESEKIVKLFDMKKFQSNVNRELRRAYPDRRRLETQCLSIVAFVKSEQDVLDCPIWVLIVNVVAMDMLKSKLPPVQRSMIDIRNRPRIPIPDEDPYSVAGNGSAGSSGSSGFSNANPHQQLNNAFMSSAGNMHVSNGNGLVAATREQLLLQTQQLAHKRSEKPPKLPPRDNLYSHGLIPKPDYDDVEVGSRIKFSRGKSDKGKDNTNYDDPYYCGLRARVPNFAKSSKSNKEQKDNYAQQHKKAAHAQLSASSSSGQLNSIYGSTQQLMPPQPPSMNYMPSYQQQQRMWQNRSYDNSIGIHNSHMRSTHAMPTYDRDFVHRHKHVHHVATKNEKQTRGRQIYVPTSYQGNYTEQDEPLYSRFQRSYSQIGVNCSCHSCIALAPLFDELTRLRPLYQEHQLRTKNQLESKALEPDPEPDSHLMKWRSESDISAIERLNDETETFERHEPSYNYGSENNLYGSILNIETVQNNQKQHQQQHHQQMKPVYYENNRKQQNQKQENILRDARSKSLSNESFFEKPTEQGCYIYEGRKRIQSVPSKTEVLCENVHSALQLQTANIKRCISQLYMQTKEKKTRNDQQLDTINAFHQRSQNTHKFDDKQTTSTTKTTTTATTTAQMQEKANISLNKKNQLPIKSKLEVKQNAHLSISDMESIYGYLKPRKQRSLSLKRIQIIEQ